MRHLFLYMCILVVLNSCSSIDEDSVVADSQSSSSTLASEQNILNSGELQSESQNNTDESSASSNDFSSSETIKYLTIRKAYSLLNYSAETRWCDSILRYGMYMGSLEYGTLYVDTISVLSVQTESISYSLKRRAYAVSEPYTEGEGFGPREYSLDSLIIDTVICSKENELCVSKSNASNIYGIPFVIDKICYHSSINDNCDFPKTLTNYEFNASAFDSLSGYVDPYTDIPFTGSYPLKYINNKVTIDYHIDYSRHGYGLELTLSSF